MQTFYPFYPSMKNTEDYRYTSSSGQPPVKFTSSSGQPPVKSTTYISPSYQPITLTQSYSSKVGGNTGGIEYIKKSMQPEGITAGTDYTFQQSSQYGGGSELRKSQNSGAGMGGATVTSTYMSKSPIQTTEVDYRKNVAEGFRSEK